MVHGNDGAVEVIVHDALDRASVRRGDCAADRRLDVDTLMGAPVAHGHVVGELVCAVGALKLALHRPDVHRHLDGLDIALAPDLLCFVLRLRVGGSLCVPGDDGQGSAHGLCRGGFLGRDYDRFHSLVVKACVVGLAKFIHSLISGGHHPCGNTDDSGAQEKDYVEALACEESLQLFAGAVAAHSYKPPFNFGLRPYFCL